MAYRYIWKITVEESEAANFIMNWREGSKVLQEYPGALGTRLHKSIDEPNTYYAIAEWESKAARDEMEADRLAGSERGQRWEKYAKNDSYGLPISVARLEEIDVVLPE